MKHYPLFLESYFLNFSYDNTLNIEDRFFFTIPHLENSIEDEYSQFSTITFGFEMNSQYQKDNGNIFYFVEYNEVNSTYKSYCNKFNHPNILTINDYLSSEELYSNLKKDIVLNLNTHKEQFLLFCFDLLITKKNPNIDVEMAIYEQRISLFINDISHFFNKIKDKKFYKNHHVNFISNKINDTVSFDKFQEIQTYFNYLDLSRSLNNANELTQKKNKI